MKKSKIIPFVPRDRILAKTAAFARSPEVFLDELETALPVVLRAFPHADGNLKQQIILLLGGVSTMDVIWPLYRIMIDRNEADDIRQAASIQLSVTASFLTDPEPLTRQLLIDLGNTDPLIRLHAAFALGWEGNHRAALPLVELLYDSDIDVQQAAVNALANLDDERILGLMLDRLEHGPMEQKTCILYNLWRFYSRREEVAEVYLKYLDHDDASMRFDALLLLGSVIDVKDYITTYIRCFSDTEARIRVLALEELCEVSADILISYEPIIRAMTADPSPSVRKATRDLLHHLHPEQAKQILPVAKN